MVNRIYSVFQYKSIGSVQKLYTRWFSHVFSKVVFPCVFNGVAQSLTIVAYGYDPICFHVFSNM